MELERKLSIETEPRTLRLADLQYAKEEAMDIMNSKTLEEAILVFTESLKDVKTIRNYSMEYMDDEEEDGVVVQQLCFEGSNCYASFESAKDVATAPF